MQTLHPAADLPAGSDLQGTLNLSIPDVKALSISDFLSRSKLDARLEPVCKTQAEAKKGERKNEGLRLEEIVSKAKEEFGLLFPILSSCLKGHKGLLASHQIYSCD